MIPILVITIAYLFLIGGFIYGYTRVPEFRSKQYPNQIKISILIPYRNESGNLEKLLESIGNIDYASVNFEVILIDDHSEDNSTEVIKTFIPKHPDLSIQLISNGNHEKGKKIALANGIKAATSNWILTTDADCIVPENWLKILAAFIQEHDPDMVVGGVDLLGTDSFLHAFQRLDFLSLQTTTFGSFGIGLPFLCNGANLAFKRSAYETVDGYVDNFEIASGDDIFLLHKMLRNKSLSVKCLKTGEKVESKPIDGWAGFFSQRKRWAAKSSFIKHRGFKLTAILVFIMNLTLVAGLILALFNVLNWTYLMAAFAVKVLIDFICIFLSARSSGRKGELIWYPIACVFYPVYNTAAAMMSFSAGFQWKGRRTKR